MKKVYVMSRVNADKCTGDKICENVCPTGAITVIDRKARVDERKCAACFKCLDMCKAGAIRMVPCELPRQRAADLPGIVSLWVKELFADIPQAIYALGRDVSVIRRATEEALAGVDMDMIKEEDAVNILCSEHAFNIQGGKPYGEMIKTTKDVVHERTGAWNIRLIFCAGGAMTEAREIIPYFQLDSYFDGNVHGTGPFDRGVPIETA